MRQQTRNEAGQDEMEKRVAEAGEGVSTRTRSPRIFLRKCRVEPAHERATQQDAQNRRVKMHVADGARDFPD